MIKEEIIPETFCPASRQEWREWLAVHHDKKQSVWLIQYKKDSGMPSITWSEAVEEALCFGWIDSIRKSIDHEKFMQFFGRRKPRSVWSKINKEKIEKLVEQRLMTPAGLRVMETAKQNGSWSILDAVEAYFIPPDLEEALIGRPGAEAFFLGLSPSVRKSILQWLVMAKTPGTRQKRIAEIVDSAAQNLKPGPLRSR